VKLTVKLPEGCPIGAKRQRRTIGEFSLVPHGTEPLHTYELPETTVTLDSDSALVIQAHYVPANDSFSVIARHRTSAEDIHVLAAGAECHWIPVSLVCRLPTGQFVEIYLQHDKDEGQSGRRED
jgi:hypothetical protein